jgi:prepilin-type N-terminal cleavage/methylation domain-containing protein
MVTKYSRGFTLIEMLVVMAIIAVLIGLIFPAVTGMQERGRTVQDMNNLRQLGLGLQTYLNDNDGAFFLPTDNWMTVLHPKYLPSWKVLQSPFDKRSSSEQDTVAPVSYGFNTNARGTGATSLLSDQITNSSMFILFAPAQGTGASVSFTGTAAASVTVDKAGGGSQGTAQGGTHNKRRRVDACMADLHVENMDWNVFKNDQANPPIDPCGQQRWNPTATCP